VVSRDTEEKIQSPNRKHQTARPKHQTANLKPHTPKRKTEITHYESRNVEDWEQAWFVLMQCLVTRNLDDAIKVLPSPLPTP